MAVPAKTLYKWQDESGKVHYSDVPPPSFSMSKRVEGLALNGSVPPFPEEKMVDMLIRELKEKIKRRIHEDENLLKLYPSKNAILRRKEHEVKKIYDNLSTLKRSLLNQNSILELYLKRKEEYIHDQDSYKEILESIRKTKENIKYLKESISKLKKVLEDKGEQNKTIERAIYLNNHSLPLPNLNKGFSVSITYQNCSLNHEIQKIKRELRKYTNIPIYFEDKSIIYTFDPTPKEPVAFAILKRKLNRGYAILVVLRCSWEHQTSCSQISKRLNSLLKQCAYTSVREEF